MLTPIVMGAHRSGGMEIYRRFKVRNSMAKLGLRP